MLNKSNNIRILANLLEKEYGKKYLKPSFDPLSELIATILSQNTSDRNSHRAFRNLKSSFKTWEELKDAPLKNIVQRKKILVQIYKERGNFNLFFLKKWNTAKIREYLNKFKGVGDKTAACVLLFSLGRPVLPVDTHILRVSKRLGLLSVKSDSKKAHQILQKTIPPSLVYPFHLNLIEHGRKICKARIPLCGNCVLLKICEFKDKPKYIQKRS
jgi:endonuclease-3